MLKATDSPVKETLGNEVLRVPKVDPDHHLLLTLKPEEIRDEIQQLEYRSNPSALLSIYRRIHLLNRIPLSIANRLKITSRFHYAVTELSDYYYEQIIQGEKLPKEATDYFVKLLTELKYAYKRILLDSGAINNSQQQVASLVYMILTYHYLMIQFSFFRSRLPPEYDWQEIHYLYFLCLQRKQNLVPVNAPEEATSDVDSIYKNNVLLGLVAPSIYSLQEQYWLANHLKSRASLLNFRPIKSATDISRMSVGPKSRSVVDHNLPQGSTLLPRLSVSTRAFSEQIKRDAARFSSESLRVLKPQQLALVHKPKLCEAVERRLQNSSPQRKEPRTTAHRLTGLVWGQLPLVDILEKKQHHQKQVGAVAKNSQSWSRTVDESLSGVCLQVNNKNVEPLPVSQLVGLIQKHQDRTRIQLGVVRWSAYGETNTPLVGIEKINGVSTVMTLQPLNELSQKHRVLVILDRDPQRKVTKISILSSPGLCKTGHRYNAFTTSKTEPTIMKIGRSIQQTPYFDLLEVHVEDY